MERDAGGRGLPSRAGWLKIWWGGGRMGSDFPEKNCTNKANVGIVAYYEQGITHARHEFCVVCVPHAARHFCVHTDGEMEWLRVLLRPAYEESANYCPPRN